MSRYIPLRERWENLFWASLLAAAILMVAYACVPLMSVIVYGFLRAEPMCPRVQMPDRAQTEYAGPCGVLVGFLFGALWYRAKRQVEDLSGHDR